MSYLENTVDLLGMEVAVTTKAVGSSTKRAIMVF
jgi:hypothetical protein